MLIAHGPLCLKLSIEQLHANSFVAICSCLVITLGMIFTANPLSINIQVTFCSHMYPLTNRSQLFGFDHYWRLLSLKVMVA